MGTHLKTRGISKGEVGKNKGKRRLKLENFLLIMKDMVCGTFREVNELASDRVEWRRVVASDQSLSVVAYTR